MINKFKKKMFIFFSVKGYGNGKFNKLILENLGKTKSIVSERNGNVGRTVSQRMENVPVRVQNEKGSGPCGNRRATI